MLISGSVSYSVFPYSAILLHSHKGEEILLSDQGKSGQGCLWRLESGPFHLAETFKDEVRTQYRAKVFNKWYHLCLNFWKIRYALSFPQREFLVLTGFNAALLLRIFSHLQDACRCKGSQHLAPKVTKLMAHIFAWTSLHPTSTYCCLNILHSFP